MALEHWLRLSLTDGIGPILIRRIVDAAGGAEPACAASAAMLQRVDGIGSSKAAAIAASMRAAKVDEALERCAKLGVAILCPDDDAYPVLLKQIPDPPAVLYVKGSFQHRDLNALAIVGSRKCSYYGREQSERFAALLAGAGLTVVSGGARGIDSAAHRGAMSHPHGRTIAVLGSGLDVPYPPENASLFEQIAARGAVVSEYPLGTPPLRDNFPRRNRIVSGLSRGVLVVEADERSGALITARQACDDHGRTVFALPGRVDQSTSAGPHQLIRDGAVLTTKLEDILENLDPLPDAALQPTVFWNADPRRGSGNSSADDATARAVPAVAQRPAPGALALTDRQHLIVSSLDGASLHVDTLIERTGLKPSEILQDLTLLSLRGIVRRVDGQTYARSGAP
ncbi:MAG TPA: DNA-processing protein DprA [Tepidisphaeraceae bacterium]|nr:DNA-processing protein DprA [Tepidisphaeraceae bacterium]